MELIHGFGKMADLVGPWKKNSGTGVQTKRKLSAREKGALTVVALHLGLIFFFMSCIGRLVNWYEKVRFKPQNKSNFVQNTDIIDVDYEVTDDR